MADPVRIMVVFGTRPEAIKLAPVIGELRAAGEFEPIVCVTGQHRQMLDQVLDFFAIEPQHDLDIMRPNQSLSDIVCAALTALDPVIRQERPDMMLVQGDTSTTFAASLAAYYQKIPVGHVEAGLRTGDKYAPWPEEVNRRLTSVIADLHFAPTERSRDNLLAEAVPSDRILVTGNTVVDALFEVVKRLESDAAFRQEMASRFHYLSPERRLVLVTSHRRENFGQGFDDVCHALRRLAADHRDIEILYPVHLNPNVREPVKRILGAEGGEERGRIHLIEPVDYLAFVYLMNRAHIILTDSGGVQEEAPSLGKPVLVMREKTERPEAVDAGTVRLVGTDRDLILSEAGRLLRDPAHYAAMSRAYNPYGDGFASGRIVERLRTHFGR